jgi:putative salt-induced outer membrane protein
MHKLTLPAVALASAALVFPALAEPVPPAVDAMIRAAGKDVDTIAKVAKSAHPNSAKEIDALVASLADQREAERTERLARAGIFDAWSGNGELGVNYTTGNTKDFGVMAGVTLMKDGLTFRHKVNGLMDRRKSNGVLTSNRALAGYELNYKFNDQIYAYGLGSWERNTFAGFTRRFTESAGAGYQVFKNDDMYLELTVGPAFQQTRYVDGRSDRDTSARAGLDFGWEFVDGVMLTEKAAILIGSQWTSTTAVTVSLVDALSARASFDVIHENNPLAGRKATDTASRLSLVYGF